MNRANQAGVVTVIADQLHIELWLLLLEQRGGAADCEFADAPRAEAASDDKPLGVSPSLQLLKSFEDGGEFLREFLNRALYDAGRFRGALDQKIIDLLSGDRVDVLAAKRVVGSFARDFAPFRQQLDERGFPSAIPDKAVFVFHFDIVTFNRHRRQGTGAVRKKSVLLGHERVPRVHKTTDLEP